MPWPSANTIDVPVYWRGSVEDLATDLRPLLSATEQAALGSSLLQSAHRIDYRTALPVITWSGDVDRLCTDVRVCLSSVDQARLGYLLWPPEKRVYEPKASPVALILWCPSCDMRHIDAGIWTSKPHHTHACQHCGNVWRPAVVPTVGVQFLPGFKDDAKEPSP